MAGHTVHTPDLFDGRTFGLIEEGMRYAEEIGFPGEVIDRAARAVEELPAELVYAGFSLGEVPAQKLAQTRPGARGALLFYSWRTRHPRHPSSRASTSRTRPMGTENSPPADHHPRPPA
ncbi:MAG TPA: hypothetical protein VKD66_11370 [Streptosporangiaceae bacterium]|nr:hypothetical protein [Streptosporangiaceae bacterium]